MNKFKVVLTDNALLDLGDIYMYIAQNDSKERAEYVFNNILLVAESLADNPERGTGQKSCCALE